ncbi:hypothetical protein [Fodinibius salsisoli]|uniref:DNA-binding protein n=1 Tax=Fodinibius salsisoli TaxID=2820877 RepID=A0ABT3PLU5_9BACT|nr:hypothetical protein [Fodinibius salsisoli]MCW9706840.1 hypothetical protein [Fodinibius salsisoli]
MTSQDPKENLMATIAILDAKLDTILNKLNAEPDKSKFMTAKEVEALIGLHHRSILNRSNLPPKDKNFVPFHRFGTRRKYFERKVIEKIFLPKM